MYLLVAGSPNSGREGRKGGEWQEAVKRQSHSSDPGLFTADILLGAHETEGRKQHVGAMTRPTGPYGHQTQHGGVARLFSSGTKSFRALLDNIPKRK